MGYNFDMRKEEIQQYVGTAQTIRAGRWTLIINHYFHFSARNFHHTENDFGI